MGFQGIRNGLRVSGCWLLALVQCTGHGAASSAKSLDGTAPTSVVAAVAPSPAAPEPPAPPPPPPPPELPGGGRTIFPEHRLVGYCGTPGAPALGQLLGNLPAKAKAMQAYAEKYPNDRKPLLVFELIVVVVMGYPGPDGMYRRRIDTSIIDTYLKEARKAHALLLLNIQPGQSDFMTEVSQYDTYLKEPDVGIALDPEWAVKAKQKPGVFYGQATGTTIDQVAAYLSKIVEAGNLPEKVLVFHALNTFVVIEEKDLTEHPGVVYVKSVDGLGPQHAKIVTYNVLMKSMPPIVHPGFKLFLDEDTRLPGTRLMTPGEVMKLSPPPEYVMVE